MSTPYLGGYSAEVPPLPIPNRVVKLSIADGTALRCGRVGSRHFESSKLMLGALFVCARLRVPFISSSYYRIILHLGRIFAAVFRTIFSFCGRSVMLLSFRVYIIPKQNKIIATLVYNDKIN